MTEQMAIHWADGTADRIIKQLGDKETYVCASGITPSGVVHFGNFREVITVDFVARALKRRGKKVRFIFSWDDFDTFRKVPVNMPKQELLKTFLFQPIVDTPDPFDRSESYAAHHEENFMNTVKLMGIELEPLFQAKKYRAGLYSEQIIHTLKNTDKIKEILNRHRSEPLEEGWLPVSLYCSQCNRDKMKTMVFDGNDTLKYECDLCGHQGQETITKSQRIKLPWRMDWPMRWAFEKVDFEPGGKDHSSEGGSYSTAKDIVKDVYGWRSPVYLQYDFISIKGGGGKMSSSKGDLVTVQDVLKVYEPEIIRWIFASYKSNVDFAISFDLDVIKTYEDFDRQERLAYGLETGNEKKVEMAKRVLELSQINEAPSRCPIQPSFRHLCNVLQIHEGDLAQARKEYEKEIRDERDLRRFNERSACALYWLENYAPDEFKFQVNTTIPNIELTEAQGKFIEKFRETLNYEWISFTEDKALHEKLYEQIHAFELVPTDVFTLLYQILISRDKGPKLAGFILTLGKDKVLNLLNQFK